MRAGTCLPARRDRARAGHGGRGVRCSSCGPSSPSDASIGDTSKTIRRARPATQAAAPGIITPAEGYKSRCQESRESGVGSGKVVSVLFFGSSGNRVGRSRGLEPTPGFGCKPRRPTPWQPRSVLSERTILLLLLCFSSNNRMNLVPTAGSGRDKFETDTEVRVALQNWALSSLFGHHATHTISRRSNFSCRKSNCSELGLFAAIEGANCRVEADGGAGGIPEIAADQVVHLAQHPQGGGRQEEGNGSGGMKGSAKTRKGVRNEERGQEPKRGIGWPAPQNLVQS